VKSFFALLLLCLSFASYAQRLWERNDKQHCVQTKLDIDEIEKNLNQKFPNQKCIYLRDSTRVVLGSFFKCLDGKVYSYFRTQASCKMFFAPEKKVLSKFAPSSIKNKELWTSHFGQCMETASEKRVAIVGIQSMNNICYCMAGKLDSLKKKQVTEMLKKNVELECAKNIGIRN
jgi:hypothetical protein